MVLQKEAYHRVHEAFLNGDLAGLRREIEHLGDFPNVSPDSTIGTPLVYAIYHSPLRFVRELLEAGANPDQSDGDGFPPIIAALTVDTPEPELIQLLLDRGADVRQRGVNDYTPLHVGAEQGDLAIVELLLQHVADANEITYIDDMETPLELAEHAGHQKIVDRLRPLTNRLDWEQAARDGNVAALRRMQHQGHDLDAKDGYGSTALMRAAHAGHKQAVEWLIAENADLDHTSKFHLSALMLAVIAKHEKIARVLVRAGADVTIEGSGAAGFAAKNAADLAEEGGDTRLAAYIRSHTT